MLLFLPVINYPKNLSYLRYLSLQSGTDNMIIYKFCPEPKDFSRTMQLDCYAKIYVFNSAICFLPIMSYGSKSVYVMVKQLFNRLIALYVAAKLDLTIFHTLQSSTAKIHATKMIKNNLFLFFIRSHISLPYH
jgi:hypothetical protein